RSMHVESLAFRAGEHSVEPGACVLLHSGPNFRYRDHVPLWFPARQGILQHVQHVQRRTELLSQRCRVFGGYGGGLAEISGQQNSLELDHWPSRVNAAALASIA